MMIPEDDPEKQFVIVQAPIRSFLNEEGNAVDTVFRPQTVDQDGVARFYDGAFFYQRVLMRIPLKTLRPQISFSYVFGDSGFMMGSREIQALAYADYSATSRLLDRSEGFWCGPTTRTIVRFLAAAGVTHIHKEKRVTFATRPLGKKISKSHTVELYKKEAGEILDDVVGSALMLAREEQAMAS